MAPPLSLCAVLLPLLSLSLSLSPYPYNPPPYPYPYPYNPPPPSYLLHPHALYRSPNASNGHHFVFGAKAPTDKLLLHTTVYKRPGIWTGYASKEITFPPPGTRMRVNITQVNAYDRGKNGTGGFVKMVRGGIGSGNVTLLFRSQKNRPINFELDIFGVPRG